MKLLGGLRKIAAFFRRDLRIARSYRASLLLEMLEGLFAVASFYYLSRFVQTDELSKALPQGGNYFGFALVGFALFDHPAASLDAFDHNLEEARQNRALESLLVTETSLPMILAGSAVYPFALMALRTAVYLAWGVFLFHFPVHSANWLGAFLLLLVSVAAFAGLGVLSASYLLLFKRGKPAKWFFLGVSGLVGGMMYPVAVLPHGLQLLARLIPLTYSLEGMRAALLGGAPLAQLWPSLGALLLFAVILLPVSLAVFAWALRRTKTSGTLTHF